MGGGMEESFKAKGVPESSSGNIQLNPIPTQIEPLPLEGSGPVLGVRQPEEQGKTLFTPDLSPATPAPATLPSAPQGEQERGMIRPAWLAGAGFAILAIGLWLLSILLKRKIS